MVITPKTDDDDDDDNISHFDVCHVRTLKTEVQHVTLEVTEVLVSHLTVLVPYIFESVNSALHLTSTSSDNKFTRQRAITHNTPRTVFREGRFFRFGAKNSKKWYFAPQRSFCPQDQKVKNGPST
jgi:hypothetical protein